MNRSMYKNQYETMSWSGRFILEILDIVSRLRLFFSFKARKTGHAKADYKRILLANTGHMGDVIIATSMLSIVKSQCPDAEIGFLAGGWALPVLKQHPLINHAHFYTHWHMDRSNRPLWKKIIAYWQSRRSVIREIKTIHYDLAIDLYAYYPNASEIFYSAGIPQRVGYSRGGCGALLTDPVIWHLKDQHMAEYHLELMRTIFQDLPAHVVLKPNIAFDNSVDIQHFLPDHFFSEGYVVFHPGCGQIIREWPVQNWQQLFERLSAQRKHIVFTGQGEREKALCDEIIGDNKDAVNLCDQINFKEFIKVLSCASCFLGLDSMAAHIASVFDIKSIIIGNGRVNQYHWKPLSEKAVYLVAKLPCVSCYRLNGCKTMGCVKKVTVDQVLSHL